MDDVSQRAIAKIPEIIIEATNQLDRDNNSFVSAHFEIQTDEEGDKYLRYTITCLGCLDTLDVPGLTTVVDGRTLV